MSGKRRNKNNTPAKTEDVVEVVESIEEEPNALPSENELTDEEVGTDDLLAPEEITEPVDEVMSDDEPHTEEAIVVDKHEVPEEPVDNTPKPAILNVDDVEELLKDPNLSMSMKLEKISTNAYPELASLAGVLLSYEKDQSDSNPLMNEKYATSKNFGLYNILKQSLNTKDNKLFKIKMDIISIAFIAFGKSNYGEFRIMRYDHAWKQSEKALITYQYLVMVFTMLANRATRDVMRSKVNLKAALDPDTTEISVEAGDRLKAYFS